MKPLAPLFAVLALAACAPAPDDGPLAVSVIGDRPAVVDPSQKPVGTASALLLSAVAQGLVRFDAAGQIEPGLAIRWDVSDDGLYYTFRIADNAGIDAGHVARWLRAAIGPTSRNPLQPVLGAVAEIVAVTPEVIEIRLIGPRPDLLPLFAQPQLAVLANGAGTGPFRIEARRGSSLLLAPVDPAVEATPEAIARSKLRLRAEPAARAVARFAADRAAVVLGGGFADLAIARAASPAADALRFDPAPGLFGFAVTTRGGFTGVADNRRALAMALDRGRIAGAFGGGWRPAATLLPGTLVDRQTPATPDWIDTPLADRLTLARETIATWLAAEGTPPVVRVAMPEGPGARMLFALVEAHWRAIGVSTVRVGADAEADLTLVDLVAPGESAAWYLRRFECVRSIVCSGEADAALTAARDAATLPERAARLADADTRLTQISAFIPVAQPLRWSLVSRRLTGWQDNRRAAHPLDQLRPR
ncbi:ABC transporter substrate-binding protein [Sphingomonas solaris]|uniref:ABC transporter substrate-binding protein n=1 Tax=Alterirhizorhabdus solaris TaxID=2529389 RepID=A0A558QYV7_9SPHN|nr:ABC transporter substrate-binding protein [Sphingomonas solaris]TVV72344.1 ABC transporter substrate-binding protein [Sphingomonas solaris]